MILPAIKSPVSGTVGGDVNVLAIEMLHSYRDGNAPSQSVRIGKINRSIIQDRSADSSLISVVLGCMQQTISGLRDVDLGSDQGSSTISPPLIKVDSFSCWNILDEVVCKMSIQVLLIKKSV